MKWLVVGSDVCQQRFEALSKLLEQNGIENTFDIANPEIKELGSFLQDIQSQYDQVRIERPYCEEAVNQLTQHSTESRTVGAADGYSKVNGTWWPRNYLCEAMVRIFVRRFDYLDLTKAGFVVGTGAMARASVAALVKLGFQRINITDRFTEKVQNFVYQMKRSFFGINLEFTSVENLTNLPGHHQVVINTTPLVTDNTLLHELYYFNYMQNHGIVVDLTLVPVETPLVREAGTVQADTVTGVEICAMTDAVWIEEILGKEIDVDSYHQFLKSEIDKIEFDLSSFVVDVD